MRPSDTLAIVISLFAITMALLMIVMKLGVAP